jgi:glyoxylase-like metal-dependent hydrolase (beta-lactamase superfamily II)
MNRRHFIHASAIAASLGLLSRGRLFSQVSQTTSAPAPLPSAPAPLPDGFVALRRNVGIFNGRGGTIGWLASPDALAVVDTQFPDTAAKCLAGIPLRGDRRIDVLINTHHHGDHTAGNPVFRPVVDKIVAHKNVPGLQRAAAARGNPSAPDRQVYADTTFADTWKLELGGTRAGAETIHARHLGPAHTGGDIIVFFEKANVVHMGDLVFNRVYPVIDRGGGASVTNWITVLETAVKTYPADAIYVFGHAGAAPRFGVVGKRDDLLAMRDYLTGLLDHVRRQIAAGKTRGEIAALENLPGFPDYHMPRPNRLGANLGVAYDELTNAKT